MDESYLDKMHTFFLGNYDFLPTCAITQSNHAMPVSNLQIGVWYMYWTPAIGYNSCEPHTLKT